MASALVPASRFLPRVLALCYNHKLKETLKLFLAMVIITAVEGKLGPW